MPVLTAKGPVLVHFFDYRQLNSVRTLPYLNEWYERYNPLGLRILGVHSPRYRFGEDPRDAERGLERLGVKFPVLIDDSYHLWNNYECEGWPSLYLWGRGGILRWFHLGEGDYEGTEEAIQEALAAAFEDLPDLPPPIEPIRPSDVPGAMLQPPGEELVPFPDRPFTAEDGLLVINYAGGGAYATAEGEGRLLVALDGEFVGEVEVDGPGLYELAAHDRHGDHALEVKLENGAAIWAVSFAPAVA